MDSIAEIKSGLHHYIAETDDVKTLAKLQEYIKKLISSGDKIIAYTSDGRALNQADYKADIDKAILQAGNGQVVPIEEMEKGL